MIIYMSVPPVDQEFLPQLLYLQYLAQYTTTEQHNTSSWDKWNTHTYSDLLIQFFLSAELDFDEEEKWTCQKHRNAPEKAQEKTGASRGNDQRAVQHNGRDIK